MTHVAKASSTTYTVCICRHCGGKIVRSGVLETAIRNDWWHIPMRIFACGDGRHHYAEPHPEEEIVSKILTKYSNANLR